MAVHRTATESAARSVRRKAEAATPEPPAPEAAEPEVVALEAAAPDADAAGRAGGCVVKAAPALLPLSLLLLSLLKPLLPQQPSRCGLQ